MTKNEVTQKLISMLRKDAYEATTLVAHYVDENKALRQEISRLRTGEFLQELDSRLAEENKTQQTNTKIEMNNLCPDCDHGLRGGMPCESCQDPIHENEIIQHKEIWRLKAENKKLRAFAVEVMSAWPDGGIEGDDLQEIACRHGMLAPEIRHEPCGEWCQCNGIGGYGGDDWQRGVECYRRTALLTGEME